MNKIKFFQKDITHNDTLLMYTCKRGLTVNIPPKKHDCILKQGFGKEEEIWSFVWQCY